MALIKTKQNSLFSGKESDQRAPATKTPDAFAGIPSAVQVEHVLELPEHALIDTAQVVILALPAGECLINQVAEIRPNEASSKEAIIDLKRMRSVSGLSADQDIDTIQTWTGAEFGSEEKTGTFFTEVSTEKLLVTFSQNFKADELTETGKIWLPDPPTDLILTLNDRTVWTHIGPVKLTAGETNENPDENTVILTEKTLSTLVDLLLDALNDNKGDLNVFFTLLDEYGIDLSKTEEQELSQTFETMGKHLTSQFTEEHIEIWLQDHGVMTEAMLPDSTTPRFSHTVDIAEILQEEINSGNIPVTVQLRAAVACKMELIIDQPDHRLTHEVVFPAQALSLEVSEECRTSISLPLPGSSSGWQAEKVMMTVAGDPGQSRVYPAVGPQAASLGELLIDSDHSLAASLPLDDLSNFSQLEAIRLPLIVETGGAEITAQLRYDKNGHPGELIAETTLQPQTLDPSEEEKWFLLELAIPYDLTASQAIWLEINTIRGRCWWQLGANSGEESAGVVSLERGVPGGPFTPFNITLNQQAQEFYGRLRLKGKPVIVGTIPAIMPLNPGTDAELSGISTGRSPVDVVLQFSESVQPSGGTLDLPLIIHAPGSYTFSKAKVIYKT